MPEAPLLALELPLLPSLNVLLRQHWSKRRRLKYEMATLIRGAMNRMRDGERAELPLQKARVAVLRVAQGRRPDEDNMVASAKVLLDAMIEAGVIVDDNPDALSLSVRWQRGSNADQRTLVTVYSLSSS